MAATDSPPPGHTSAAAPSAAVSVIVPVHNTRRYLDRSLGSVFTQTLPQDRIEVIAVDDGSTDGSGRWLSEAARTHPNLTVLHRPASGGAGRPRNTGLAHATGDFVFFLDSDDRLGPEALARLTQMARTHGSDIVYGRIVGADGRAAPVDLRITSPRVSPFDSPVYWSLAAYKLFRRSFLDRHRLRFVEGRLLAEDLPFGIAALLRAETVSVLADYDCYYLHGRDDDSNATRQDADWPEYLSYIATVLAGLAAEVPPGEDRDALMVRHFHGEILMPFAAPYLARAPAGRRDMANAARPLVARYLTDRVLAALPPRLRLRAHCLRAGLDDALTAVIRTDTGTRPGPPHVDPDGRVYAAYPYFRDPVRPLPDACYDLTHRLALRQRLTSYHWRDGTLHLHGTAELPGLIAHATELVLRGRGAEYRLPTRRMDGAWHATLDPATAADGAPLTDGIWGLKVAVTARGATGPAVRRAAWLHPETEDPTTLAPRILGRGPATPTVGGLFLSHPHGHLHLDLDGRGVRRPVGGDLRGRVTGRPTGRTRGTGRTGLTACLTLPGCPADAELQLILTDATRMAGLRTSVERGAGDRLTLRARLRGAPRGTWQVAVRFAAGALRLRLPVEAPEGREPLTVTVPPRRPRS
ncbi:glycosyltransferase family 2 protein [Streptomyces sp. NPDC101150]|uniref:glycosyltransferase family 2 protein n=1 Tax=Streptomyces sp. NPDC101150 TaxID=3366114 RepID=UPI00382756A1